MDEQLRILKMVEEGTITAEQGAELMAAMNIELPARQTAVEKSSYDKKMLRIIVDSVRKILKATGKLPIPEQNLQGVDLEAVMEAVSECLDEEIEGDFVNVAAADGTTVRIFIDK